MKGKPTEWTADKLALLRQKFPTSYNRDIADEIGVSWRTIVRKARELGLEKEEGFLDKRRAEIVAKAVKSRAPNPTKGLKGWCVPGSEKYRFKKGHTPANVSNPAIREKMSLTRKEIIRKEKLRLKYGLAPKTKLKIVDYY